MQQYPPGSTQPTPIVRPEQPYPPPSARYYPPQTPIPPTSPKKRMRRSDKIALGFILSLIAVFVLIVVVAETQPTTSQLSTADINATVDSSNALTATALANTNATEIASNTSLSNDLTQQAETPTPLPTTPVATTDIGRTQQSDVWSVTLNSVKEGQGDGYLPPKSGDIYLYFNLTAQNTDTSNHLISVIDFSVTDSDGNKYGFGADSNYQDISGTVIAGQKLRGWAIFEVAKSAHSFTLQFDPTFDPNQAVQWNVLV